MSDVNLKRTDPFKTGIVTGLTPKDGEVTVEDEQRRHPRERYVFRPAHLLFGSRWVELDPLKTVKVYFDEQDRFLGLSTT